MFARTHRPPACHRAAPPLSRRAEGSSVVVIPAGVPRKPGMSRDDLFATNAGIVATLVDACAKYCPKVRTAAAASRACARRRRRRRRRASTPPAPH